MHVSALYRPFSSSVLQDESLISFASSDALNNRHRNRQVSALFEGIGVNNNALLFTDLSNELVGLCLICIYVCCDLMCCVVLTVKL